MKHTLIFKDEKLNKIWNIETSSKSFTATYGKTGTAGLTSTKDFDSDEKVFE